MQTTSASLLDRLRGPAPGPDWERFVRLYTPLLLGWARGLKLPDPDAADLVQDVFVVLLEQLPEFRYDPNKSFRTWLRTVLYNRWRNLRARRSPAPLDDLDPPAPDSTDLLGEQEYRRHLVGRALALLRTDFQELTWRAFWESAVLGRPPADVAAELGVSTGAVYNAKSRVVSRLRQELAGLLH
ncbi:MAG: sigma-70 family polymerase sigma factor [Gemmataceae bacterium]|nr:sigma-70 family polymerase sigma factor [Gemmataceae bacterium]